MDKERGLRRIVWPLTLSVGALFGGSLQFLAERDRALLGPSDKFPGGFLSFNPWEELFEGSISFTLGGLVGLALFRRLNGGASRDALDAVVENTAVLVGGITGYAMMAFVLGPIAHSVLGVSDVKWGL